jgi:signal transduction histidine kinase
MGGASVLEAGVERSLLETILQQMPAGVVIAEAPSGRVVFRNEAVSRIWGGAPVSPAESIADYGRLPGFHLDGRPYQAEEWPLARSITTGEVVTGELVALERGDGTRAVVELNSSPVHDHAGRIVAAVAIMSEVTVRERRERAEREFITNAAHELQTPLTAITSAIEVLQGGAKEIPADRDHFLSHIQTQTYRLTRLVHALLVLARAESGGESPRPEPIELRPLLDDIALGLQPAAGVEIRVRCPARLGALANRELFEQAVGSMAANAAKYTERGEIRLTGRAIEEGRVAIDVADTGPGLPPGEEDRVLERFYRVGGPDGNGFGLGLAIARQAVDAIGGRIELRRRRTGGTVARIIVPQARELP